MNRKAFPSVWKRAAVSAVIAYALVLQAFLLSFTGAVHAAPAAQEQGILCAYDSASDTRGGPAKAHDGLCCVLGCHGHGPSGGLPPVLAAHERITTPVAILLSYETPLLRLASAVLPVGSRAPPHLG